MAIQLMAQRLALVTAALGVQGVQVIDQSRLPGGVALREQLTQDVHVRNRAADSQQQQRQHSGDWPVLKSGHPVADTPHLAQPTLLQYFMALTRNGTQLALRGAMGNQTAAERRLGRASWATGLADDFVEDLNSQSSYLLEGVRSLQQESMASAGLVAEMAARSANRTGSFVEEVAVQSAGIVAEMHALERQSASRSGKAGPAHAFPQVHVAPRRPMGRGPRRPAWAGQSVDASGHAMHARLQASVGATRVTLTLAGLCLVLLSGLLAANRKSLVAAARPKMALPGRGSDCTPRSSRACSHDTLHGQPSGALSVWDGTVAVFSTVVGTGLLAMPYAFSLAGLIAVPVVLFFVCCSAYTAHLMAWSLNSQAEAGRPRGWGFLVELAFGQRAKAAIDGFLLVELWGYLLSAIVCTAMNVAQLLDDVSTSTAVAISVTTAYALTFVPVRLMTRVSVASNVVFVACCVMFIATGLLLPTKAPASDVQLVKPQGLISAAGILVYSPAGHAFYPALMQRMEEPAKFPCCIRRAYAGAALLYLAVAVPGYCLFGNAAQPSAVQNIGADLQLSPIPHLGWMSALAAAGMVAKMLTMQSLVLPPLASTAEGALVGLLGHWLPNGLVAPITLGASAAVAVHFASEMATLLNLLGSVFCMNIAFVVPVLCYWQLSREPLGALRQVIFVSLMALGGTFAVLGVLSVL